MTSIFFRLPDVPATLAKHPGAGRLLQLEHFARPGVGCHVGVLHGTALLGRFGVIAFDGGVLQESTHYSNTEAALMAVPRGPQARFAKRMPGAYCALHSLWCDGFWHWMLEFLPRVILAEAAGFRGRYILPPQVPFARPTLQCLGLGDERLIDHDGQNWEPEELWIPKRIQGGELADYPGLLEALRQSVLQGAQAKRVSEAPTQRRRLYLSREFAKNGRKVVNEAEVVALLRRYDVVPVLIERFPFAQQVELMADAELLISAHGAGLVHALFMPPRSQVVELFSPEYLNPCMGPVMGHLQHRYHMLISDVAPGAAYAHGANVMVNLRVLEAMISSPTAHAY